MTYGEVNSLTAKDLTINGLGVIAARRRKR